MLCGKCLGLQLPAQVKIVAQGGLRLIVSLN
jgi:hypothetical protein